MQLVKLIKETKNVITMAIGDGANDVGMITEANVGIGIQGVEGTQAARSSDYSITKFENLKKLLFFHGREYYRRNTWVIGYNFYKNVLFISMFFWTGIINMYCGITVLDPVIHQLFNTLFVAIPCGWYGIYSLQFPQEIFVNHPELYIDGMKKKLYGVKVFLKFVFLGLLEGFICFIFCYYFFGNGNMDGSFDDFYSEGTAIYAAVVVICNLRIFLQNDFHEIFSVCITGISILSYFFVVWIMSDSYILSENTVKEFYILDNWDMIILDIKFWVYLFLVCVFCYFIEVYCVKYYDLIFGNDQENIIWSFNKKKSLENKENIKEDGEGFDFE